MKKNVTITTTTTNTSKSRRIFASIMSAAFAISLMLPSAAFAITADEAKNQDIDHSPAVENVGDTEYWLQLEDEALKNISVDVPIKVVLAVDTDGSFFTPTALKNVIENDSEFPVNVSDLAITAKGNPGKEFVLEEATGFDALSTDNIFNGTIASAALTEDGTAVDSFKQTIAFTQFDQFAANMAWGMQASDADGDPVANEKTGDDCLFIQIDGAIANVNDYYFTSPINVFDITYTFEATDATLGAVDNQVIAD